MRWLLKFHKSRVCFISIQGQLNSHLPGKSGAHFVIVQNNSVLKDAEKITLRFLNITRVSSSRIWVYWVWKLIFKCLSNLRITNNFSLQWSQIPHFLDFHYISYKTNMKKLSPFFPITGPHSLSCMYWFISTKKLLNEGDESWSVVTSLLQEVTTNASYYPCLNCCFLASSKLGLCLFFPPLWKPPENPLHYSKLWNFTSTKIWVRDVGLSSQVAIWYKSPIKCHKNVN